MKNHGKLFIPPSQSSTVVELCHIISETYVRNAAHVSVKIDSSVDEAFATVKNAPAIVMPNHPASEDPFVLFQISSLVHEKFFYLTTREIFQWHPTLRSTWLQKLGCYSILRASADVDSFRASIRVLTDGTHKVVIFPEGEISRKTESLIPLEKGAVHLALRAAKARKEQQPPIYLLPLAILYRFERDESRAFKRVLKRCETRLSIDCDTRTPCNVRLQTCFEKMLSAQEAMHHIGQPADARLGARVQAYCRHIAKELAKERAVNLPEKADLVDQLHLLKNSFTVKRYCDEQEPTEQQRKDYDTVKRLSTLMMVDEHSFTAPMSQESVADVLAILCEAVLHKQLDVGCKTAYIHAPRPIAIPTLVESKNRQEEIVAELQHAIAQGLNESLRKLIAEYPSIKTL